MVAKAHSKATKLAATSLARLSSADVAAATFRVDVQTVRRWQAGADAPPDDTWTAVRDVLLARGAEMAARGETSGLVQTLTAAGISDRNVRYSTLIARREARRSEDMCDCVLPPGWVKDLHPKANTPEHAAAVLDIAAAQMSQSRRHFMYSLHPLLALYIDHNNGDTPHDIPDIPEAREAIATALAGLPNEPGNLAGALQQWIEGLDDETLAARQALVDDAFNAYREAIQGELQRRGDEELAAAEVWRSARASAHPATPEPEPEPSDAAQAAPEAPAAVQAAPRPSQLLRAPSQRGPRPPAGLHVVSEAERSDPNDYGHPSWRRQQ